MKGEAMPLSDHVIAARGALKELQLEAVRVAGLVRTADPDTIAGIESLNEKFVVARNRCEDVRFRDTTRFAGDFATMHRILGNYDRSIRMQLERFEEVDLTPITADQYDRDDLAEDMEQMGLVIPNYMNRVDALLPSDPPAKREPELDPDPDRQPPGVKLRFRAEFLQEHAAGDETLTETDSRLYDQYEDLSRRRPLDPEDEQKRVELHSGLFKFVG